MTTLISSSRVVRRPIPGIDYHQNFSCNQLHDGMVIVEPSFKEFSDATAAQLTAPIKIGHMLNVKENPQAAFLISYSRANAKSFKGWINDLAEAVKGQGYTELASLHIPFESYGVPMVGSVLAILFGPQRLALKLPKSVVFPGQEWPEMMHHAPSSRAKGGVYPGTAALNGYLNSRTSFLPDLSLWDTDGLRAEYRDGDSLKMEPLRTEDIRGMFGADSWQTLKDLHLCTPASLLAGINQTFVLLD